MNLFQLDDQLSNQVFRKQVEVIFKAWAISPNGKNHRVDPNTKTYKLVAQYVYNLRHGLPLVTNSKGKVDYNYFQFLKRILNIYANNDKQLVQFIHRKWKTREIVELLNKVSSQINQPYPLPQIFWMPFVQSTLNPGEFRDTGFSYFSLYGLNRQTGDQYLDFVNEFYAAPFARYVSESIKQRDAIHLEQFMQSKNMSMSELKNLFKWYFQAREDPYVKKVDTIHLFIQFHPSIARNRAEFSKRRATTNRNAFISPNVQKQLKNLKVIKL